MSPPKFFPRPSFDPIRTDVGIFSAARRAHEPDAERRDEDIVIVLLDVHGGLVAALFAVHEQSPHAVGAHVAQRHRRAVVRGGHGRRRSLHGRVSNQPAMTWSARSGASATITRAREMW